MGTRAYATEVCNAIDPDGSLFAGRILSRDESGSESPIIFIRFPLISSLGMTQKNIERLFPVDQSMVVIIDDRADVWNTHQNNLVKVIPCAWSSSFGLCESYLLFLVQTIFSLELEISTPGYYPSSKML
jgi:RNA polymerase II subunit A-like phosphatase